MIECHMCRNARTHGIAHDVCLWQAEMIKQMHHILGHDLGMIGRGLIKFLALSMPAIIKRNNTITGTIKHLDPLGIDPVHRMVGGKTMHKHNSPLLVPLCRRVDKGKAYGTGLEEKHGKSRFRITISLLLEHKYPPQDNESLL